MDLTLTSTALAAGNQLLGVFTGTNATAATIKGNMIIEWEYT